MAFRDHSRKRVSYFYDRDVVTYFGQKHPMKPFRLAITHNLIMNYGLYKKMSVFKGYKATAEDMRMFHSFDYVNILRRFGDKPHGISEEMSRQLQKYHIGTKENDCPLFEGLYNFCQISAGGSLAAAVNLNKGDSDIAINWAGGLHHAKKSSASGFCYVNDIVLGIVELLKYHQRVLYIDIDVHHGDGVEEAFYITDRVMTVSFHRFGEDFFPFTGGVSAIGAGKGKHYALNIPLKAGMDDSSFERIFTPIMKRVNDYYRPDIIVLQCGADSLAGDRLGDFNLTLKGHGKCVELIRSFNVPLMLLGGGGYTVKNVSRCWTYETAIALNTEISNHLPHSEYSDYFSPDLQLHISPDAGRKNKNTVRDLEDAISLAFDKLSNIQPVPSVQIQETPGSSILTFTENDDDEPSAQQVEDERVALDNEFYDEY